MKTVSYVVIKNEFPAVAKWLSLNTSDFAKSLRNGLQKYGSLTERQFEAVKGSIAREQAKTMAESFAEEVVTGHLMAAFDAAQKSGLKKPKLRFEGFECSPAPKTGKNPGAVYVKANGEYAGKIMNGKYTPSAIVTPDLFGAVIAAMADPLAAAVAYGKRTGSCSCCGRTLTDPVSVADGIGPICKAKFQI